MQVTVMNALGAFGCSACELRRAAFGAAGPFPLDFRPNRTDNAGVEDVADMIYSPSDMPQGLRRGSAFPPGRLGVDHAL